MSRNTRKIAKCPSCLPNDAGAIFYLTWDPIDESDFNGEWAHFWICTNCGHRIRSKPRREKRAHHVTPAQYRTIERLERTLPLIDGPNYEFKTFEITTTNYGAVWLRADHGRKGDEGTVAELIARDHWHIQIGTRGGLKIYSAPKWAGKNIARRL